MAATIVARPYANGLRPIKSCCVKLLGPHLISMDVTVEEQVNTVLVGQQLHGSAHLLRLLVAGVSCGAATQGTQRTSTRILDIEAAHHAWNACSSRP